MPLVAESANTDRALSLDPNHSSARRLPNSLRPGRSDVVPADDLVCGGVVCQRLKGAGARLFMVGSDT
jgi:hypothetical protein